MENTRNKKGQFTVGNTGRPRGAGNRVTSLQKVRIAEVLEKLEETLIEDIAAMKPREKIELWRDLQEFIQPKLQRVAVDVNPPEEGITKITFEVVKEGSEVAR